MHDVAEIRHQFDAFSPGDMDEVRIFFAPGRVNLIGEHLDYNGGLVFPAALTIGVWAVVRPRKDGVLRFKSLDFDGLAECEVDHLVKEREDDFANYPKGVIREMLKKAGTSLSGADFLYYGNLPNGAGLSSSAAVEVVTGTALTALAHLTFDAKEIAVLSQAAENQFVGVHCGIMDQFAVAMGQKDHAIALDCATLEFERVPVDLGGYQLVITNTNERRGLSESKYNERRRECEQALVKARNVNPDWTCLADIPLREWGVVEKQLDPYPTLCKRARHVVTEQHRTKEAVTVLKAGDLRRFGQLMNESHQSLSHDYEVTGSKLDALANAAWTGPGCIGSRMTGAGFGGCTVSIVESNCVDAFMEHVKRVYQGETGVEADCYVSEIGDGAHEISKVVFLR